ncbi:MAG: WD40/YVTN/BNR-like repeat-containing protein, partial [Candidatus Binataceae bacterium]
MITPGLTPPPLSATQRQALAQFFIQRRGLQFGVPNHAYATAVNKMHAMSAATSERKATEAAAISPNLAWSFIGPEPMNNEIANFGGVLFGPAFIATGRITALAIDPTVTPNRIFVGAANGGIWMSSDGGKTFTPIADSLPTQAIGAIALDTVNLA